MFKEEYLLELLSGKLTSRGYANILGTITSMVRKIPVEEKYHSIGS